MPDGFVRVEAGGRVAWAREADVEWVRQGLTTAEATTRPAEPAARLVAQLTANRDWLVEALVADLGVSRDAAVDLVDNTMLPRMSTAAAIEPDMIYFVASAADLKSIVKGGWTDPRFYYNRAADQLELKLAVTISADGKQLVGLIPVMYADSLQPDENTRLPGSDRPATATELKTAQLTSTIRDAELSTARLSVQRTQQALQDPMVEFIATSSLRPLQLRPDQEWFGQGVLGILVARYTAKIAEVPLESLIQQVTGDNPRSPVRASAVDALNLVDPASLRREIAPAYVDALRRKGIAALYRVYLTAGEGSIGQVLAAVKAAAPADGEAIVTLIKEKTGIDLTPNLTAR